MLKQLYVAVALGGLGLYANAVELTAEQRAEMAARISPVGKVCVQGNSDCMNQPVTVDPSTRAALMPKTASPAADEEQSVAVAVPAEDEAAQTVEEAAQTVEEARTEMLAAAQDAADEVGARATEVAEQAADAVEDTVSASVETAGAAAEDAAEAADSAAMEVAEAVSVGASDIDGQAIYSQACIACHMSGVGGAPILGNAEQWAPRIAKGMDTLYASGLNGVAGTAMIAKGGRMDLSDAQIKAAVDYMVASSQ